MHNKTLSLRHHPNYFVVCLHAALNYLSVRVVAPLLLKSILEVVLAVWYHRIPPVSRGVTTVPCLRSRNVIRVQELVQQCAWLYLRTTLFAGRLREGVGIMVYIFFSFFFLELKAVFRIPVPLAFGLKMKLSCSCKTCFRRVGRKLRKRNWVRLLQTWQIVMI